MKQTDIEKGINPFAGIDIKDKSDQELEDMLMTEDVMETMYNNLSNQFIDMVTPFIGKGLLFRARFNRQSRNKHFSTFPKVGPYARLEIEGFWEPMDVTKEASTIAYSNYERGFRKGDTDDEPSGVRLDDGTPLKEASAVDSKEVEAADNMFKGKSKEKSTTK